MRPQEKYIDKPFERNLGRKCAPSKMGNERVQMLTLSGEAFSMPRHGIMELQLCDGTTRDMNEHAT